MISDTLSDAVAEIDRYLDDDTFGYSGELRTRILVLRDQMNELRRELDTLPVMTEQSKRGGAHDGRNS